MIGIYWRERRTRELPEGGDATTYELGELLLDIAENDDYQVASLITEDAVEAREQITDHQVPQLDRASVTVVVSNSPLDADPDNGFDFEDVSLPSGRSARVLTSAGDTIRGDDAFTTLRRLCREGIDVDVEGLRRPLEGWLIGNLSSPRSVGDAGTLVCTISFQEVSVAAASETDAPSPRVERGRSRRDRGRQQPQVAGDSTVDAGPQSRDTAMEALRSDLYDTETGEPL